MGFSPNGYAVSFFVAGLVSCAVGLFLVTRKRESREVVLGLSLFCGVLWSFSRGVEACLVQADAKYLVAAFGYVGSYNCIPLLLAFSLGFSGYRRWLTARNVAILWAIPVAMIALAFTNGIHHLVWTGIEPIDPGQGIYRFLRGPAFWLGVGYNYSVLTTISIVLLGQTMRSPIGFFRRQSLVVLLGLVPPWLVNVLFVFRSDILRGLDLTPHAFAVTGLVISVGMTRFKFLKYSPRARSLIFRKLPDAVAVLDGNGSLIDANEAFERLADMRISRLIGLDAAGAFFKFPALVKSIKLGKRAREEVALVSPGEETRVFDVETGRFSGWRGCDGWVVQFRDITYLKKIEAGEREQRLFAEGLRDMALAITTIPDPAQVLERVADNVFRLIPCLSCSILLSDGSGKLRIATTRGALHPEASKWLGDGLISADGSENIRIMAETGKAFIIPDTASCAYWKTLDPRVHSWMGAPIRTMGTTLGFINLDHETTGFFTEALAERIQSFADLAAVVIRSAGLFRENEELANTDPLTGLYNRRHFFACSEREFVRARRYGSSLSMLMIDLDRFKQINDEYGHQAGDRAIKETAKVFHECLRDHDLCGRFGGDEFCVLLPETDEAGALGTAWRLVETIRALRPRTDYQNLMSASIGVAVLKPEHGSVEELLQDADHALYRAKESGRNRACV